MEGRVNISGYEGKVNMSRIDELVQENRALRERLSRLGEAHTRINESLDFDTVLQGVLDSARALMQARYGVITLYDDSGQAWRFLSSGITSEQAVRLWKTEEGSKLFRHFNRVEEPLRVPDILGFLGSIGMPEIQLPMNLSLNAPLLVAPIFHRGEKHGHFFIADREDGKDFSQEDEDTLVMFVSQAAMVISNARRYRDEQKARTNLETLIDTSPVGVVVLEGRSGSLISSNREARRTWISSEGSVRLQRAF